MVVIYYYGKVVAKLFVGTRRCYSYRAAACCWGAGSLPGMWVPSVLQGMREASHNTSPLPPLFLLSHSHTTSCFPKCQPCRGVSVVDYIFVIFVVEVDSGVNFSGVLASSCSWACHARRSPQPLFAATCEQVPVVLCSPVVGVPLGTRGGCISWVSMLLWALVYCLLPTLNACQWLGKCAARQDGSGCPRVAVQRAQTGVQLH